MVEHRARNPEVRGSNPGSGSSFSLEIYKTYRMYKSSSVGRPRHRSEDSVRMTFEEVFSIKTGFI